MILYKQTEDLTLMGVQVTTFPNGIKEAFGSLMNILGYDRDYYGVSWLDESDNIEYYAMARELFADEARQHNYELLITDKGEYQTEVVHNWLSKTDCIKDVFHNLMRTSKPDKNHPCVEWYRSDEEMLCMIRTL